MELPVRILLADKRGPDERREELHYEGGLEAFVRFLDRVAPAATADAAS